MSPGSGEFEAILTQLTDGEKWKLASGEGWNDFAERLGEVIASLDLRRRQAIVMALVAIATGGLRPTDIDEFLRGRNCDDDAEIEALIDWLRGKRPRFFEG